MEMYFDSRQCLQPAYRASASRACLLLQEDGPRPSRGCVVSRAELSQSTGSRQQEGRLLSQGRGRKCISLGSRSEASEPFGGHWNCLRQADGSPLVEPLGRGVETQLLEEFQVSHITWQEYFSFRDQCRGGFLQEEEPTSEHLVLENTKQRGKARTRLCFRCAPKPPAAHRTTGRQDLGRAEAEVHRQPWLLPPPGFCEDGRDGLTLTLTPCRCGCLTQARTEGRT